MKGQSFILEFVLFFFISFSLFTAISYLFYSQNIYFEKTISESNSEIINDLISIDIINAVNCKACDIVFITQDVPQKIGGSLYKVQLYEKGVNTTLISVKPFSKAMPVFNLNETYNFLAGETLSDNKIVRIKINNINEEIGVE
jgi:hypothetical protein